MAHKPARKKLPAFTDEVYPNSPLVEVVCEIRFDGNLTVECNRHKFWERIRKRYPVMKVPHPKPDMAMALSPFRFETSDGEFCVMFALNSLALSSRKYPGYKVFGGEFRRLLRIFGEVFGVEEINRAGWRYVNVIPFVREQGLVPVGQFLQLGLKLPDMIPEKFDRVSIGFTAKNDEHGKIVTRLETIQRADSGQEALLLDFDYGMEGGPDRKLRFTGVPGYIEKAHGYTRRLFEQLITAEYREYLRGNVL